MVESVVPFWRRGKWITGVVVQREEETGKRRLKLFKGRIKDEGKVEVEMDGKKYRVSLVQRINIPSMKYWIELKEHVDRIAKKVWEGREEKEEKRGVTLFDFQ